MKSQECRCKSHVCVKNEGVMCQDVIYDVVKCQGVKNIRVKCQGVMDEIVKCVRVSRTTSGRVKKSSVRVSKMKE